MRHEQVGHSTSLPPKDRSHSICWSQSGHENSVFTLGASQIRLPRSRFAVPMTGQWAGLNLGYLDPQQEEDEATAVSRPSKELTGAPRRVWIWNGRKISQTNHTVAEKKRGGPDEGISYHAEAEAVTLLKFAIAFIFFAYLASARFPVMKAFSSGGLRGVLVLEVKTRVERSMDDGMTPGNSARRHGDWRTNWIIGLCLLFLPLLRR